MCFVVLGLSSNAQTKVYLIPSLHGLHKTNHNYSYDSLRTFISRLKPDVIAVEIRSIDVSEDTSYLKNNYPYEMWKMRYWFRDKKIEGFDWLGNDINGKLIPQNYWREISEIKKTEKALNNDSIYSNSILQCDSFLTRRLEILQNCTLKQILESNDAILCNQYYNCYSEILSGTKYELIPKFNQERNERILQNINELQKKYNGKTIVIITGDDHYVYLKDKIQHNSIY